MILFVFVKIVVKQLSINGGCPVSIEERVRKIVCEQLGVGDDEVNNDLHLLMTQELIRQIQWNQ